jgi:formylglycine-generating enzyme
VSSLGRPSLLSDARASLLGLLGLGFLPACEPSSHLPQRCGAGLVERGARCCPSSQQLVKGECGGAVTQCPQGFHLAQHPRTGCVHDGGIVRLPTRSIELGPDDWGGGVASTERLEVMGFLMDLTEVTVEAYYRCELGGACTPVVPSAAAREPGVPITGVSPEAAARFCAAHGGALPRREQWLRASLGANNGRFPWGQTGLVCRRAAFGLARGPCATGGETPELVGSRPDGKSGDGLFDLVGNAAELAQIPRTEPAGLVAFEVWGGSFRSRLAAELRSWSAVPYRQPSPEIGFRCVYTELPAP